MITWRRLLLTLCAFALLQLGVAVWMQELHFGAMPGFSVSFFGPAANGDSSRKVPTATPEVYRLEFPPSNQLAQAGLQSGDLLDLRAAPAGERYRWATGFWWAGEQSEATIIRGPSTRHVTLTAQWLPLTWYARIANAGIFWMLLFATILAWRRPDSREARTLALLLILSNIGIDFQSQNWITPWPMLDAAIASMAGPLIAFGIVLLATYAMLFARPANALRRALAWVAYAGAVLSGTLGLLWPLAIVFRIPYVGALSSMAYSDITAELSYGLPLLCLLATIPQTHGAERARITWASASLLPFYVFYSIPESILSDTVSHWLLYVDNIELFLVPLGLTYSLLSRRLLDVDFALNRAAVFAVTSLLLAGLFAGLQWLANALLTGLVRVHNILVDMTIVVIVYYAMRVSRRATDAIVTGLFFPSRNRRLLALRDMGNAIDEISDEETIAPFAEQYLRTNAHVEARVFLQASPDDDFPSADDRELGVAFPMTVRGQLRGILFCRPPDDGEFAPDEVLALQQIANRIATDRDDLLAASLRGELNAVRLEMHELRARLGATP